MADEPRRSGRATKGQHTKNLETPAEPAPPPPPPKPKGRSKAKKQEEEDAEEKVRCLCGAEEDEDDEGRAFTCCDNCNVWQHNDCMGLPSKHQLDEYFCEQCRPEDHPQVIEALQRGEKPEEIAAHMREEVHSKKKGGRKSKAARVSEVKEEPPPPTPVPESNKRKPVGEPVNNQPTKLRKPSAQIEESPSSAKPIQKPTSDSSLKLAGNMADIKNPGRQNTAQALKKKFAQVIKEHSSKGKFRIPDGHTSDSLGEKFALLVEYSMFINHCGNTGDPTPAYKDQFRIITSNVGPNPSLLWDLFDGKLTADTLSTMSSSDMATDEQKRRDKEIKEENERLAQLKEDQTARRIRRTHKGEEYVEDDNQQFATEPGVSEPPSRRMTGQDDNEATISQGAQPPKPPPISTETSQARTQDVQRRSPTDRRSSSNFNIKNVWSSVQSPTTDVRSPSQAKAPQYNQRQAQPGSNDADIDRLLEDDGAESAPYSPTESGMDPSMVWRGKVDMPSIPQSIAKFEARAYHVAGSNLEGRDHLASIFPNDLALGGRIAADRADDYLTSLSAASRTDVTVLDLVPNPTDGKSQSEFTKLFDYLQQRNRFGVVREPHRPPVRDVYIIPIDEGTSALPTFLNRLEHNVIEEPRPRRMLVVVFVIRYKTPPASAQATPTAVAGPPNSALSPTAPGGAGPGPVQHQAIPTRTPSQPPPAMSPTAPPNGQAPSYYPSSGGPAQHPLPDNPYAPSPSQPYPSQVPAATAIPQQPHPPPPPQTAEGLDLAHAILGEHFTCPTAQKLMNQYPMNQDLLQQLRKVFENRPDTRTDFVAFQQALTNSS